jgi:hypothetical protein
MSVNRSLSSKLPRTAHRAPRGPAVARKTEIARAARLYALDVLRRLDRGAEGLEVWWRAQIPRTRVGLAIVAVLVGASFLNILEMRIVQATASQPAVSQTVAPVLTNEAAPADAGKMWAVAKMWQGTGVHDTETFTVTDHWRVDWLFNQTQSLGQMQVYIYSADGRLLNIAANAQRSGADTTFWVGPGTYLLKINASGGDWKLDVQDLH